MHLLKQTLDLIPPDQPCALLIRHSARDPIVDWDRSDMVGLTEQGVEQAEGLGNLIAERFKPGRVVSSTVGRCVETAAAILRGANWPVTVIIDQRLSHTYIQEAWVGLADSLYSPLVPPEVQQIVDLMLTGYGSAGHLDLFITHDTVVGSVVGYLLDEIFDERNWPGFLEGFALWKNSAGIYLAWREKVYEVSARLNGRSS